VIWGKIVFSWIHNSW